MTVKSQYEARARRDYSRAHSMACCAEVSGGKLLSGSGGNGMIPGIGSMRPKQQYESVVGMIGNESILQTRPKHRL